MSIQIDNGSSQNVEVAKRASGWAIAIDRSVFFHVHGRSLFEETVLHRTYEPGEEGSKEFSPELLEDRVLQIASLMSHYCISREELIRTCSKSYDSLPWPWLYPDAFPTDIARWKKADSEHASQPAGMPKPSDKTSEDEQPEDTWTASIADYVATTSIDKGSYKLEVKKKKPEDADALFTIRGEGTLEDAIAAGERAWKEKFPN